ncbi:hypothetical protein E8E13_008771 [Curvularia kusanoi]|uniref:Uncharacterized protein n=1 Tax=Curvularia kusanoi TaxID=90978 RepID=A0A9P4TDP0_CURKU|nr:hypothetical protein E8E13_008771 [Curvularia kusanoi]
MNAQESTAPGAGWDEAQCMAALAQLEQLQAQIDDLRLAIPRIIEPFHQPPNPTTFKRYSQGVIGSQNGIKILNDAWKAPEMQDTLAHITKSYEANPDLSASTSVPSHGWSARERRERESRKGFAQHAVVDDKSDGLDTEIVSRVMTEVQGAHPDVRFEAQDTNRSITTHFVASSMKLSFKVNIDYESDIRHVFTAECMGVSEPFLSITRCLASRSHANDLKYLLNMIVAYKTVKGASCAKCEKLLDANALIPTARRSKQVTGPNDTSETVWEAFHEGCL